VRLGLQELCFYPRDDGMQRVLEHRITVNPAPSGRNEHLDLEGNRVTQLWFECDTEGLDIHFEMRVETLRNNAYDFILNFGAMELPVEYDQDTRLANVYLERSDPDPSVTEFARTLDQAAQNETLCSLNPLTGRLYGDFSHVHRQGGDSQRPASTLMSRSGACGDLALLFMDCCRAPGYRRALRQRVTQGGIWKKKGAICTPGQRSICPAPAGGDSIPLRGTP
jgi:transglutaminase-like putative cysteine protease